MVNKKGEKDIIGGSPSDLQNESTDLETGSEKSLDDKDSKLNVELVSGLAAVSVATESGDKDSKLEVKLVSDLPAAPVATESDDKDRDFSMVWGAYKRQSAGVISDVRRKEQYLKPSVRKKMKSEAARRKRNKRNRNLGKHL